MVIALIIIGLVGAALFEHYGTAATVVTIAIQVSIMAVAAACRR